jgi:hypothetical protein
MAINYDELYTRRMEFGGGQSFSVEDIDNPRNFPESLLLF